MLVLSRGKGALLTEISQPAAPRAGASGKGKPGKEGGKRRKNNSWDLFLGQKMRLFPGPISQKLDGCQALGGAGCLQGFTGF